MRIQRFVAIPWGLFATAVLVSGALGQQACRDGCGAGSGGNFAPVVDAHSAASMVEAMPSRGSESETAGGDQGGDLWEDWSVDNSNCATNDCGDPCGMGPCASGNCDMELELGCGCGTPGCGSCTSMMGRSMFLHASGCQCNACRGRLMGVEFFGELLYLRPRDSEVAYAVPIDGPIAPVLGNGIQIGDTRVVDINHRSGFRIGVNAVSTVCGRLTGQWAHYESRETDQFAISSPNVVRSLVTHPLGANVASDGLQTGAGYDIDFDLVDFALQTPLCRSTCWAADVIWGLRYGQLGQDFSSQIAVNGTTFVNTEIDFNGLGPRIGLIGQRNLGFGSLYSFGRSEASFLVGKTQADYLQRDAFAGTVVDTGWEAGRVVPQLELEMGLGCGSRTGRFQVRTGYLVSAWFNTVNTSEFINATQQNNPDDLGEGLTFDGWNVRCELRF